MLPLTWWHVLSRSWTGLQSLRQKHSLLDEVRGLGLIIAFQLSSVEAIAAFQKQTARYSVRTSLSTREWVRLLPPLVISEADADHLLKAIDESLTAIS